MARTVMDCALLLLAIAGPDSGDPTAATEPLAIPDILGGVEGLRIGVPREHFFDTVEPEVEQAVREAITVLAGLGAEVQEVSLPHSAQAQVAGNVIMSSESAAWHEQWLHDRPQDYGSDVLQRIRAGLLVSATEYLHAQQVRTLVQQDFRTAFERVDVVVAPTVPLVAPAIGKTFEPGGPYNVAPRSIANRLTVPCNLTGMPAISLPCGFADGLPIGLQIMGPAFAESLVLRVAHAYEHATDWHTRQPELQVAAS